MGTGNLAFFNDIPISENPSFPKKKSFTALPFGAEETAQLQNLRFGFVKVFVSNITATVGAAFRLARG
jgi:hypothetical protein